jgi:GNAT superfamily N-acetyltransferase
MVQILPLSEKKEIYPIPAFWAYINWYLSRDIPFNIILNEYKRRAAGMASPYTFMAFSDDIPAGMVTLKQHDLASRKDLSPWLSALYVVPEFRNQGIGSQMINRIIEEAGNSGYKNLHLFIDNRDLTRLENYYIKRGWQFLDSSPGPDGETAKIYSFTIQQTLCHQSWW